MGYTPMVTISASTFRNLEQRSNRLEAAEVERNQYRQDWTDLEAKALDCAEAAMEVARQDSAEGEKVHEAGSMNRSNTWQAVARIARDALAQPIKRGGGKRRSDAARRKSPHDRRA